MTLNRFVIAVLIILGVSLCIPPATAADWPEQIYAPYIDYGLWQGPTINEVNDATGVKYYSLAFINVNDAGQLRFAAHPEADYKLGDVKALREKGGNVIISFGGLKGCSDGDEPAQRITDEDELVKAYSSVIDTYGTDYIDFDIEHKGVTDKESITRRHQAILKLREKYPDLKISTTLAVTPDGFTGHELNYLNSATDTEAEYKKSTGKDVLIYDRVNIMLMDYGGWYVPAPDKKQGERGINAANAVHKQLSQGYYKGMSDAEIWKRMGLTPMIGQNDVVNETFYLEDAQMVAEFAGSKGAGMVSIWSMTRDTGTCPGNKEKTWDCSGLEQDLYEFSNIFKNYASMSISDVATPVPMSTTVWPDQFYAPYIDYGLWQGWTINEVYDGTGVKYFTLAFISVNDAGELRFAAHPEADYKLGDVKALREKGGDVIISFGGAYACGWGNEPAQRITDVDELVEAYSSVIDTYGVNYIDFDIEDKAIHEQGANSRRNLAILKLKEKYPGLKVSATLAVSTVGFPGEQLAFLSDAKSAEDRAGTGVKIFDRVNIMLMDYGKDYQGDMGEYAISASNGVHTQLSQGYYKGMSDAEIWKRMGLTPMIGQNDQAGEIFTLDNARQLAAFAGGKGAGMMSIWSMTRDQGGCDGKFPPGELCSSIPQEKFEFTNIFKNYYSDYSYVETPTPTPTSAVTPTPTHATGLIPGWDSEKEYDTGDRVLYNKEMYAARYWTMGEEPGIEYVWMETYGEPIPAPTPDTGLLVEWDTTKIYLPDERVLHDGDLYSARWLTMGEKPGATYVWDLVSDTKPTPEPTPDDVIPTPTPDTGLLMEWKPTTLYHTDERVLYDGEIYTARWSTKNERPGDAYVWALTTGGPEPSPTPDTGLLTEWDSQTAYHTGDKVTYKGHMYRASWWTKGEVPGLAYVWELADSGTTPAPTPTPHSGGLLPTPTHATGLLPTPTPATGLLG